MANNSLNKERTNAEKILVIENKEKRAVVKTVLTILMVVAIVLAVAAVVVSFILFEAARPWMISVLIGIVYIAFWNLIKYNTCGEGYIPWYTFTNICMAIACIPLICVSDLTRVYAFGFALAIFIAAIGHIIQCALDNETGIVAALCAAFIGGILFAIATGCLFDGLVRILVIGCGIAAIFILMSIMAAIGGVEGLSTLIVTSQIILGLTGIAFLFVSHDFTILAMCFFGAIILSAFTMAATSKNNDYSIVVLGAILAGISVLVFFFAHPTVTDGFVIKDGVLVSYKGTAEVVVIPEEVTEIGKKAFKNSGPKKNMKEVVLHEGIESIGDKAFKNCDALEAVVIPNGVKTLGKYAFYRCDSLESVTIAGTVEEISDYAFGECSKLTTVVLEEGITTIGMDAFYYCSKLKTVTLPDSVEILDFYCFSYCDKLSEVYMGSNVESIGARIFQYSDSKITVYYSGTEEEWNDIEKSKSPKWNGGAKVDVVYNHE